MVKSGLPITKRKVSRAEILSFKTAILTKDSIEYAKGRSDEALDCYSITIEHGCEFMCIAQSDLLPSAAAISSSDYVIEHLAKPFEHFRIR